MPKPRLKKRAVFTSIATVIALLLSSFSPLFAEEGVSAADRQARVNAGFKKGKTLYDAGKFEDAYREWETINPYLDETSSVRKVIEFLKNRAPEKAKTLPPTSTAVASTANSALTVTPVTIPRSMPALIDEAEQKLDAAERHVASEAEARKSAAGENERRQAAVDAAFERGKRAYEANDPLSTITAWKEVADLLDDESLRGSINDLERRLQALKQKSDEVPAQGEAKAPAELKELLEKVAAKSEDEARLASGKRSASTGKVSRRQEEVRASFEKGRRLYGAGDLDGALAEWETLAASVEDGDAVRTLIASIRADRDAARKASERPAASAPAVRAPQELVSTLETASQKIKAQIAEARARIAEAGKAAADSSENNRLIREGFERGRVFFESGKIAEAIAEWEQLPASAGAGPALSALKENYRLLQESKAAPSASASAAPAFSSEELAAFLETASRRMKADLSEAQARRAASEEPIRAREDAVRSSFENGKLFYYQGRYDEALAEWEKAMPFLEDGSDAQRRFKELRDVYRQAATAKNAAATASSQPERKLKAPEEFARILEQANQKLNTELKEAQAEKTRTESATAEKRGRVDAALRDGKALFDAGNYERAFEEWNRMLPYLEDASGTRRAIESLKTRYSEYLQAKKAASEFGVQGGRSLTVPSGDIAGFLEEASARLGSDARKAREQRAALEKTIGDRQAWVDAAFKSGQALYAAGKTEEAVEEWSKILVYVDDKTESGQRLSKLKKDYEEALSARKDADAALTRRQGRVASPADFGAFLEKAAGELRVKTEAARSEKNSAELSSVEREKSVKASIESGRALYAEGRLDEAMAEWEKAVPQIDGQAAFSKRLETLRIARQDLEAAQSSAAAARSKETLKIKAPADLDALLEKAAQDLSAATRESVARKENSEASAAQRQALVDETFEKGKAFYGEGRIREAFKEWKSILPYLRETDFLKPFFDNAEKSLADSEAAVKAAAAADVRQNDRLSAPAELSKLLDEAARRARDEAAAAKERQGRSDASLAQRTAALNAAYERGNARYTAGDVEAALKEWSVLSPQVEEGFAVRLNALADARTRASAARTAADDAMSRQSGKLRAPEGFDRTLDAAAKRLEADRADADAEKAKADRASVERQKSIDVSFQKAKTLFAEGHYEEAIAQWKKLAPYLENDEAAQTRLAALSDGYAQTVGAKKAAVEAAAGSYKGVRLPDELISELDHAGQVLKDDLKAAQADLSRSELSAQERRAWVDTTFKKAAEAFTAGRIDQAVEGWNSLLPYLEESSQARPLIDSFKARAAEVTRVKAEAETSRAKQDARFPASEESLRSLSDANARLAANIQSAQQARLESERKFEARRSGVDAALEKAQIAARAGRYEEAIAQWNAALPELENAVEAAKLLEAVNEARTAASAAETAAHEAAARENAKLKAPQELAKALSAAAQSLRVRIDASQKDKLRSETSAAERQAWVRAKFAEGKAFYDTGDYGKALTAWKEILPYLEEAAQLKSFVDDVERALAEAQAAQTAAQNALAQTGKLVPAPEALGVLLGQANESIQADTRKSVALRTDAEKSLAAKKEQLGATLQRGKQLYEAGKYAEAIAEWEKLEPSFRDDAKIKASIAAIKANHEKLLAVTREASDFTANEYNALKAPYAGEIQSLLDRANTEFASKTADAAEQKKRMEGALAERQAWIRITFENGKKLYDAGQYPEAFELWGALSPYLENETQIKETLDKALAAYRELAAAQKAASEAASKQSVRFPTPENMAKMVIAARERLEKETQAAIATQSAAQKTAAERDAFVKSGWETGRRAYEEFRFTEAVAAWMPLVPYFEDGDRLRPSLETLAVLDARLAQARRAASEAIARKDAKTKTPEELTVLAARAREKLQKDTESTLAAQAAAQKTVEERDAFVKSNWESGRRAYDEGRFTDAAESWSKLVPYLEAGETIQAALDALTAAESNLTAARNAANDASVVSAAKLKTPQTLVERLTQGRDKLEKDIQSALAAQSTSEAAATQRRNFVEATLTSGRQAFEAGHFTEASEAWSKMLPYLEEGDQLKPALDALVAAEGRLAEARRSADQAAQRQIDKLPVPQGLAVLLSKASDHLEADIKASEALKNSAIALLETRRAAVASIFEEGRQLNEKGRYEEAFKTWKRLIPDVEGGAALGTSLDSAAAQWSAAKTARASAEEASARQDVKLTLPGELPKTIADIRAKLSEATQSALDRKKAAQTASSDREANFAAAFEKGKALYVSGDLPAALASWKEMLPYVDEPAWFQSALAAIEKDIADARAAKVAADAAAERAAGKLGTPQGLETLLSGIDQKIKSEIEAAAAERGRLEKSLADRQAALNATFQNGKALFGSGKIEEALAEWDKLGPALEDEPKLKGAVATLRMRYKELLSAQRAAAEFTEKELKHTKMPFADEMQKLLESAELKFASQTADAEKQKAQTESVMTERQAWIQTTFEKGKTAYDTGRYAEAFEQWNAIAPYLENEARIRQSIDRSRAALEQSLEAKKAADATTANQDAKFKAPEVLAAYLDQATQKSRAATQAALAEKAKAEKTFEDKRLWITFTFQDGKNLYDAGKYKDAVDLWGTLVPYLENGDAVQTALKQLTSSREEAEGSRRAVQEAVAKQEMKFQAPEDIVTLLSLASRQLKEDTTASGAQKNKAEQILKERQAWIDATFAKGKAAYDAGDYGAATKEWNAILPYLQDAGEADREMQALSKAYEEALAARRIADETEALKTRKFAAPAELEKLLGEANERLTAEMLQSKLKQDEAKETVGDRKARVDEAFRKGKALYQNEQYEEALAIWASVLPEVEQSEEIEKLIASVSENRAKALEAKRQTQAALAGQTAKIRIPEELPALLKEADAALKAQAFDAQSQKTKAEQTAQDRQAWVAETFQRGKAFYDQGEYRAAAAEWTKLAPYTDDKSGIADLIESVKQSEADTLEAKKAAVEAVANEYKGLKLNYSDQIVKLLDDANRRLKTEAAESQKKGADIETAMAERKEWSTTTFNKGKILYEQGRFEEALAQWDRLLPYLESESRVRQLIESLKVNYQALLASQGTAGELSAKEKSGDVPYIQDMAKFFDEAARKLTAQTIAARTNTQEAEKIVAGRKAWIESAYRKGREAFDARRYEEAVQAWDTLRPYLAEAPDVQKKIESAKRAFEDADKAKKAADAAEAKKSGLPALPKEAEVLIASYAKTSGASAPSDDAATARAAVSAPPIVGGEFVSGEVTAVDQNEKTITMKLYTVNKEKSLVIHFDAGTKVDGSQAVVETGNAIDLRYDPATKKALYIYVY